MAERGPTMQTSLTTQLNSRTFRWVTLLLVLIGVFMYMKLIPDQRSTKPVSTKEFDKLELLLKEHFANRIKGIGSQENLTDGPSWRKRSMADSQRKLTTLLKHFEKFSKNSTTLSVKSTTMSKKPTTMSVKSTTFSPRRTTVPTPVPVKQDSPKVSYYTGYWPARPPQSVGPVVSDTGVSASDIPSSPVNVVSCARLIAADPTEHEKAHRYQDRHPKRATPDDVYIRQAADCPRFRRERRYLSKPLSKEEGDFSIAFSLLMFKDVEQTERLLRAIYRPQNFYCLHVDKKSLLSVHRAVEAIAACFDNVFIASRSVDVQWAWYSVLEPDLICMEDLYKRSTKWRYFINLTGQEWPLKTNLDLVRILKIYNGTNDMEGTVARRNMERTQYVHQGFFPTEKRKMPQPHNIQLTKGSVHITASRAFVDYVLHNKVALDFREWVKDSGVPDETFFSSLSHSPHLNVPGAFKGKPETHPDDKPFLTRFKNWGTWPFDFPCGGMRVRMVCIFGLGDLPLLSRRPEFFANKFYIDYQPLALDCMEELHYNRTREELLGTLTFATSYYEQLSFVKHHV